MTIVCISTVTEQDIENALVDLWLNLELYSLETPKIWIQFEIPARIRLVVTIEGSMLADRVVQEWAVTWDRRHASKKAQFNEPMPRRMTRRRAGSAALGELRSIGSVEVADGGMPRSKRGSDGRGTDFRRVAAEGVLRTFRPNGFAGPSQLKS
jgi:hypothetical protein